MKTSIEITVRPFIVPNFVIELCPTEDGGNTDVSRPLASLNPETLDRMCSDFREAVFKKAGKQQPATCARME